VGESALVESKVADAISLVQKLDATGSSPTLAAWYYYDDADEWRLLIGGPSFEKLLPKQESVAYQKLVAAMAALSLPSLTLSDVKLVSTESPLPQALRFLLRTPPNGIARAHFTDTTINRIFIKEMVILRSA
jgi:hypothetical protein